MNIEERRAIEFEKYRKAYRDYPLYKNRQLRIDLTREWIDQHPTAETLLDVGCGRGEVIATAVEAGKYATGCDVVEELISTTPGAFYGQAHDIPRASSSFGLVTCTDVLEHILEDDVPAVLAEIARVARGPILLAICHIPDKPGKYGPDTLHITVHPREWWEAKILEHMGAEPRALYLDRVNGNGTWFEVVR